ncbi:uncharacterized protein K452DRAFT_293468 [Aplosporella prunicola CBS 121167]|uniref:Uncharacterized protein n=1 Tax=Aplosporella prunicola CBS 121167 TaxID=1176127 RepID=A0A6A6AV50_9PEZI|nr:uncharacterized protein K452DRAFT_293468 [Aplosporella prunicola CBS 121167]KAF2135088.1 hypothetical protein K452DRAFT_293468 [Aplosporella prunicola CBS 121167]
MPWLLYTVYAVPEPCSKGFSVEFVGPQCIGNTYDVEDIYTLLRSLLAVAS